jgi:hypothetical protein
LFALATRAEAKVLSDKTVNQIAKGLVDPDYFSKSNTERGSTTEWPSRSSRVLFLEWGDGHRYCAQEFKVKLIDGKARGDAGEPFCSEVSWPGGPKASSSSRPRRVETRSNRLTLAEARMATVERVFEMNGFFWPTERPNPRCTRVDRSTFRCGARLTVETFNRLRDCSIGVLVRKDGSVTTKVLRRKCWKSDRPYLSFRTALKAAKNLVDKSYFNATGTSGSMGRSNLTTFTVDFLWSSEDRACLQPFKVKLIEDKVRANAGDAACADRAPWP